MERPYFIFFPLSPTANDSTVIPSSSSFECSSPTSMTKKARTSESSSTGDHSSVVSSDQPMTEVTSPAELLKLFDESPSTSLASSSLGATISASSNFVEEDSPPNGVSTELKLYENPWKMTKILTISDLNNLCRLLMPTNLVKEHVYPYMSPSVINRIMSEDGVEFKVWDVDTRTSHALTFKIWTSCKSHVFKGNWKQDFVNRRNLQKGDRIGLFWDIYYQHFCFSVRSRAEI